MSKIKYYEAKMALRETYRTRKYGNLLSDTYLGEVQRNLNGNWNGWFHNLSDIYKSDFKLNLKSKRAAVRWVNQKLREVGVE